MRMRMLGIVTLVCLIAAAPVLADSLWGGQDGAAGGLYGRAGRAFDLGDIITIELVENTRASSKADLETEKDSQKRLTLEGINRIALPLGLGHLRELFGQELSGDPTFGLTSSSDFEGEGETNRSATVTGTVTAQVVEVMPNGTLKVEATQTVYVNEEMNQIVLTGIVRPEDVDNRNTVQSTRIANAEIYYTGRGPITNTNRRGLLTELWEFLWPF